MSPVARRLGGWEDKRIHHRGYRGHREERRAVHGGHGRKTRINTDQKEERKRVRRGSEEIAERCPIAHSSLCFLPCFPLPLSLFFLIRADPWSSFRVLRGPSSFFFIRTAAGSPPVAAGGRRAGPPTRRGCGPPAEGSPAGRNRRAPPRGPAAPCPAGPARSPSRPGCGH